MTRRGDRDTPDRPSRSSGSRRGFEDDEPEFTIDPEKVEALAKLREHVGKETFDAAVDAFKKEFGLPEPFDLLQLVFENHKDVAVRAEALQKMDETVDRENDATKQVFKTRVKLLQMTAREPDLKRLAVRIARSRKY